MSRVLWTKKWQWPQQADEGLSWYAALQCAETGQVDVFLTKDDQLIRAAHRALSKLTFRVLNPISFLEGGEECKPAK